MSAERAALPLPEVGRPADNRSEGGPAPTEPRPLDRYDSEGSGPVAIVPEPSHPVPPTPADYADRMARIDGCPATCGNTEAPWRVTLAAGSFVADYKCADCGHEWFTSWGV